MLQNRCNIKRIHVKDGHKFNGEAGNSTVFIETNDNKYLMNNYYDSLNLENVQDFIELISK